MIGLVAMDRDAIRAFAHRGWAEAEVLKRVHWASRFARDGASCTWQAGQALRAHASAVRADWPTAVDRDRDLLDHVRLKRMISDAACAFARR